MKLSQIEKQKKLVALLVGKSGSGKTSAAASFTEAGEFLEIDFDLRIAGIRGCEFLDKYHDTVEVQTFGPEKSFQDFDNFLTLCLTKQAINSFPYKTTCIDSVYTLADCFLRDSMRLRGLKGFEGKLRGTIHFYHPDDYNYVSMCFHKLTKTVFPKFKCNLILTGWIVDQYGKDPSNEFGPNIILGQKLLATEKLAEQIPGYFDEVYYFKKEIQPNGRPSYFVEFDGSLAKTSFKELRNQRWEITGKSFYKMLKETLGDKIL